MNAAVVPRATYRLQLGVGFTLADATTVVPYLERLGVSHCYTSPYLKARSGSSHGYDIVDHRAIDPELGGPDALEGFVAALRRNGMGHVMDLVSNHMGVGGDDNRWWLDVLEHGPASPFARHFDIDWAPLKEALRGKVLCPFLGEPYGAALEQGLLRLRFEPNDGAFAVHYYEHRFPLAPETYPRLLEHDHERLAGTLGGGHPDLLELESVATALHNLPPRQSHAPDHREERRREVAVQRHRLADLCRRSPEIGAHLERTAARYNGRPDRPESFDPLHALLEAQSYRPAFWRVASDEINYRRFFDINDLAGLRMERPEVFHATHALVRELVAEGLVDGIRIDHPDGLYDPVTYLRRLTRTLRWALPTGARPADGPPCYLLVEKILATHERLPGDWPVHGTTGYEFAQTCGGLFVHPDGERPLDRLYARFTGRREGFDEVLHERKRLTIQVQLSSELTVLASLLDRIAQRDRRTRDFTLNGLRDALTEVVACFPVYRTYRRPGHLAETDRRYVEWAVAQARKRRPAVGPGVFDFIRDLLLRTDWEDDAYRTLATRFAMKFQQYTGPVMAKAMEDTAFYVYNRLVSLNEVGGDPRAFGVSVAAFHHANQERARDWPHALLATATHDTKRGEDVRARIHVLSECPDAWRRRVFRWARLNRDRRSEVDGAPAPSRNDEYLLYQTLIGTWPVEPMDEADLERFRARIRDYMVKAVREAKAHTSWVDPNVNYEEAVTGFVDRLLSGSEQNAFLADFLPFQRRIARAGMLGALAQLLLKLTAPGVPDLYQGCELWQLRLVDPDNREPVDYGYRDRLLRSLEGETPEALLAEPDDGRIKLFYTWRLLQYRRQHPEIFRDGEYLPLEVEGGRAEHLCAFARRHGDHWAIAIAGRWFARLADGGEPLPIDPAWWGDTRLVLPPEAPTRLEEVLSGKPVTAGDRTLPVGQVLGRLPAVLLSGHKQTRE